MTVTPWSTGSEKTVVALRRVLVAPLVALLLATACSDSPESEDVDAGGSQEVTAAPEATAPPEDVPESGPTEDDDEGDGEDDGEGADEAVELAECLSGQAVESEGMVDLDADGFDSQWLAAASAFAGEAGPNEEQSTSEEADNDSVSWSVRSAAGELIGLVELVPAVSGGWLVSYSATCVAA